MIRGKANFIFTNKQAILIKELPYFSTNNKGKNCENVRYAILCSLCLTFIASTVVAEMPAPEGNALWQ